MRLSKVAKELNVGIANVVDHLASKGIEIDGRPNTKITPEAYELLKQQFMADVEQHKRSLEVAQERLEEKEAIKASVAVKSTQKEEVIKAKSDLTGPKMVGKIDVQPKATSSAKEEAPSDEVVEPATQAPASEEKASTPSIEVKPTQPEAASEAPKTKKKEVIKAKGALSGTGPKQVGKIDVNKPVKDENITQVKVEKFNKTEEKPKEKPVEKKEEEVLKGRSKTLSGPKLTGQVIDLSQFSKPKKKVASSSNPAGNKDNKKKRKRISQGPNAAGKPARPNQKAGGNKGRKPKVAKVEPTEEEIQKKIAETLDKLTGKGKTKGSKHRRSKRDERREQDAMDQMLADEASKVIKVTEFVTVNELATMMNVQVTQIISSCMMLGIMVP